MRNDRTGKVASGLGWLHDLHPLNVVDAYFPAFFTWESDGTKQY